MNNEDKDGEFQKQQASQSFQAQRACILGDFNTLAHTIARLSPNYCLDYMRWGSLGYYGKARLYIFEINMSGFYVEIIFTS